MRRLGLTISIFVSAFLSVGTAFSDDTIRLKCHYAEKDNKSAAERKMDVTVYEDKRYSNWYMKTTEEFAVPKGTIRLPKMENQS